MTINNGRGACVPLPLPPGATMLKKPIRMKVAGWEVMTFDARFELDGITWVRVQGGFGDGQATNWHPREDWVAIVPALTIHVGRMFSKPDAWTNGNRSEAVPSTIVEAARAAVIYEYEQSTWPIQRKLENLENLHRAVALLESSILASQS